MKDKLLQDGTLYEEKFRVKESRDNARFVLMILLVLFFSLALKVVWQTAVGAVRVSGRSMEQTLQSGDKLLVQNAGWWHQADYGDVIVVDVSGYQEWQESGNPDGLIIKRLIAKAGDSVYCEDGTVYLKKAGESEYAALIEPYAYYSNPKEDYDFGEYVLGEGEIFFLGDNRFVSQDSRYKEGYSRLTYLYKQTDIVGTVSEWAIENRKILEGIFFN